jgi:hypothetical protein
MKKAAAKQKAEIKKEEKANKKGEAKKAESAEKSAEKKTSLAQVGSWSLPVMEVQ